MSRVSSPPKRIEALLREADAYEARCLNPISRPSALLDDDMDDGWRIVTRLAASLRAEASARQLAEQERDWYIETHREFWQKWTPGLLPPSPPRNR